MDRTELIARAESLARTEGDRTRRRALILGASRIRKLHDEADRIRRAADGEAQTLAALIGEGVTSDALGYALPDPVGTASGDSPHGISPFED